MIWPELNNKLAALSLVICKTHVFCPPALFSLNYTTSLFFNKKQK